MSILSKITGLFSGSPSPEPSQRARSSPRRGTIVAKLVGERHHKTGEPAWEKATGWTNPRRGTEGPGCGPGDPRRLTAAQRVSRTTVTRRFEISSSRYASPRTIGSEWPTVDLGRVLAIGRQRDREPEVEPSVSIDGVADGPGQGDGPAEQPAAVVRSPATTASRIVELRTSWPSRPNVGTTTTSKPSR